MSFSEEVYRQVSLCSRCGYCRNACQTSEVRLSESWNPRGRIILVADYIDKLLGDVSEDYSDRIYSCLLCGRCESYCPSHVQVVETMEKAREILVKEGFASEKVKSISENIIGTGNPEGLPRKRIYRGVNHAARGKTLLFRGCTASLHTVDDLRAAEMLLRSAEYPFFEFPDEICCGYPLEVLGYEADASRIYSRNHQKMMEAGVKKVVTACPYCYRVLHERYPRHIDGFEVEALHIIDLFNELMDEGKLTPIMSVDLKVSYQDPCALGRGSLYQELARHFIERVPGVRLMENEDSKSKCCGAGSYLPHLFPKIYQEIRTKRVEEFISVGAQAVITSCPTCLYTLREASKNKLIAVDGLSSLLAISVGLDSSVSTS
ncbi:MAG: 4Fe-4S dicluster domain-containing protein, partial [Nitrososphaeria archaeon]|nr:4Fe-4S dicluster domain-containing protein [Nitrososphaeria archaeon]NIN51733.1 4Fe-4S dicluster domain-containing protein [Nitrososphaeria archaeon]NIQ32227.1 4Fe-4S dicluster domain-containing protein [Nitrososphaeria archaeon]